MHDDPFEHPPAEPLVWFQRWMDDAAAADFQEPTGMGLATVDAEGRPSLRIVLFKGLVDGGFSFYTNGHSRKGAELEHGASAALCFWWDRQFRQVRVEGDVRVLPAAAADTYFASRPRGSQVGAWASAQSQPIANRAALEAQFAEAESRFAGEAVPRPPYWRGYCVQPQRIEFWQGRQNRLHDRLLFERVATGGWQCTRLQP